MEVDPTKEENAKSHSRPRRFGILKDQNFTELLDQALPENTSLAKQGNLHKAIENLLQVEKTCRQAEDVPSTTKVAVCIVSLCWEAMDLKALFDNFVLLSKRRGQLRTVIKQIVEKGMVFVDQLGRNSAMKSEYITLIQTLRSITEGKIFVELERARLTRILAKIHEEDGEISVASKLLQEIAVETYGSMEKLEKTDFLLEQVRLCLDTNDFVRAFIISNKVNRSMLLEEEFAELKLRFYKLMIKYFEHHKHYLEVSRCYLHIYDTPKVQREESSWIPALQLVAVFTVLTPFSEEQSDLIARVVADIRLPDLPEYRSLITFFTTHEIISWPQLFSSYKPILDNLAPFGMSVEANQILWEALQNRVVEHNVRVIARYYSRISLSRLSELLALTGSAAEEAISRQVQAHDIYARIDRPAGIVSFIRPKDPAEELNLWASSVSSLLELLEDTCHLIHRENVAHHIA